jgi:uncharacterized protein involved in exopolysaccharide biosynthesis/Mrp family chromosome partitioning ATPase
MSDYHKHNSTTDDLAPESLLSKLSAREMAYIICRHKWKIMLGVLLGVIASLAILMQASDLYESEANLLVRFVRETVSLAPSSGNDPIISSRSWDKILNSEMELLGSQDILEKVVERDLPRLLEQMPAPDAPAVPEVSDRLRIWASDLKNRCAPYLPAWKTSPELTDRENSILSIKDNFQIEIPQRQNILALKLRSPNPQLAQAILGKIIDYYLEKHIQVHRIEGTHEFFQEEARKLGGQLQAQEQALNDLKNEFQITSIEGMQEEFTKRITQLEFTVQERESMLAAAKAKLKMHQSNLADLRTRLQHTPVKEDLGSPYMLKLRNHLYELKINEQELLTTYTPNSPPVVRLRRQIEKFESLLGPPQADAPAATVEETIITPASYGKMALAYLEEKQNLEGLQAESDALNRVVQEARQKISIHNDAARRIAALKREIGLLRSKYEKYDTMAEDARIDQAKASEKIANISVVQPATLPLRPLKSDIGRNALMALFAGIFVGLASAFLTEKWLDHSIKGPDDVESLFNLPTLTSIPYLKTRRNILKLPFKSNSVPGLAKPGTDCWDIAPALKAQYDMLCENMLTSYKGPRAKPIVIGVTSNHSGEGVSTVAANLAVCLAEYDGRVLLVDANLRRPQAKEIFNDKSTAGFSEIEVDGLGRATVLQHNLYLLPAHETSEGNTLPSVSPQRCEKLMSCIRNQDYGFVILDMPPLDESATALRLARLAHNIVLVVESEGTRREVIQQHQQMLHKVDADILGVVLNKRQFHIPNWLYQIT